MSGSGEHSPLSCPSAVQPVANYTQGVWLLLQEKTVCEEFRFVMGCSATSTSLSRLRARPCCLCQGLAVLQLSVPGMGLGKGEGTGSPCLSTPCPWVRGAAGAPGDRRREVVEVSSFGSEGVGLGQTPLCSADDTARLSGEAQRELRS